LKKTLSNIIPTLIISFILYSCTSVPLNLQLVKKDIMKYYESGEYSRDLQEIISNAENEIDKLNLNANSAVVFDVDETSLSNYQNIKEIYFGYDPVKWDNWIMEAKAPAIPEVKNFYNYVIKKNIKVIFLSSRKISQYNATYHNLKNAGYTTFDTLILKDSTYSGFSSLAFKSAQRELLSKKGYVIIADIGDQKSDLEGKFHGLQIKLPNYIYIIE
jgi:acid phosphatase